MLSILGIGGFSYSYKHTLHLQMAFCQVSGKQGRFGDSEKFNWNNLTKTMRVLQQKQGQTLVFQRQTSPSDLLSLSWNPLSHSWPLTGSFPQGGSLRQKMSFEKSQIFFRTQKNYRSKNSSSPAAHAKPDNFPLCLSMLTSVCSAATAELPPAPSTSSRARQGRGGLTVPHLMAPGLQRPCHHLFVPAGKVSKLNSGIQEAKILFLFPHN